MNNAEFLKMRNQKWSKRQAVIEWATAKMLDAWFEIIDKGNKKILHLSRWDATLMCSFLSNLLNVRVPMTGLFHWIFWWYWRQYVDMDIRHIIKWKETLFEYKRKNVIDKHIELWYIMPVQKTWCMQIYIKVDPTKNLDELCAEGHNNLLFKEKKWCIDYVITAWTYKYFYYHHDNEKWQELKSKKWWQ